jgi:hypothetical protein
MSRGGKTQIPGVPGIDWAIAPAMAHSGIDGLPIRVITFSLRKDGVPPFEFSLPAEEAYDLREEIGRAYDRTNP